MEEAPENGKESLHSAHANGMNNEWMNEPSWYRKLIVCMGKNTANTSSDVCMLLCVYCYVYSTHRTCCWRSKASSLTICKGNVVSWTLQTNCSNNRKHSSNTTLLSFWQTRSYWNCSLVTPTSAVTFSSSFSSFSSTWTHLLSSNRKHKLITYFDIIYFCIFLILKIIAVW